MLLGSSLSTFVIHT